MHRVRRMVVPLIIAIRMAATITVPATATTVPAIRATTIGQVEILVRTIAPVTTARATIIVLTIAPIIAQAITIRTGHPVRVIVPG